MGPFLCNCTFKLSPPLGGQLTAGRLAWSVKALLAFVLRLVTGGEEQPKKTLRYEGALIFKKVNLFIEILTEMYGQAGVPGIPSRGEELTQAALLRHKEGGLRKRPKLN